MGYERSAGPPARIGKAPAPIAPAQDCASPHRPPHAAIPASALPRFSLANLAVMPPSGTAQRRTDAQRPGTSRAVPSPPNRTGLPDRLKSGIEALSGVSMDEVKVHYNSSGPARINALAFARGREIHLARGQEAHLPHEAWHLVQQARGRVRATGRVGRLSVNDDHSLEREADVMGMRAAQADVPTAAAPAAPAIEAGTGCDAPAQAKKVFRNGRWIDVPDNAELQPGDSDGEGLSRRRVPGRQPAAQQEPPSRPAPGGRSIWATHDAPDSHGPKAWASAGFQFLTGTIDPLALKNAQQEARMHSARAAAELRNARREPASDEPIDDSWFEQQGREAHNARISASQATLATTQAGTATPLGHHLISLPLSGDAIWYSAKAAKLELQKTRRKPHID